MFCNLIATDITKFAKYNCPSSGVTLRVYQKQVDWWVCTHFWLVQACKQFFLVFKNWWAFCFIFCPYFNFSLGNGTKKCESRSVHVEIQCGLCMGVSI